MGRVLGECHREESEAEIEVTPEMIEAGIAELARYNPEYESDEKAVTRIYEAMLSLSPKKLLSKDA